MTELGKALQDGKAMDITKEMLLDEEKIEKIAKYTKLPIGVIEKLKKEIESK